MWLLRHPPRGGRDDDGRGDRGEGIFLSRTDGNLTGGEPSLWIDKALISRLREAGKQICIETNGTRPLPDGIDWVTCSPKENAPVVLERVDEIKVVYTGQDLSAYAEIPARYHFLQPCSCQNTKEVVDYILRHPRWRLSLQTHKLIDIQ